MKQIEYTEKQKLVIEILEDVIKEYKPDVRYDFERAKLTNLKSKIFAKYGIQEKFLTLREFIKKHEYGAYHHFFFTLCDDIKIDVIGIDEYLRYYVSEWLDYYYVISYEKKDRGEGSDYYLTLSPKEDK